MRFLMCGLLLMVAGCCCPVGDVAGPVGPPANGDDDGVTIITEDSPGVVGDALRIEIVDVRLNEPDETQSSGERFCVVELRYENVSKDRKIDIGAMEQMTTSYTVVDDIGNDFATIGRYRRPSVGPGLHLRPSQSANDFAGFEMPIAASQLVTISTDYSIGDSFFRVDFHVDLDKHPELRGPE